VPNCGWKASGLHQDGSEDLANTLVALADPYDDFALLACLRSPMANLSLDSIVALGAAKPVIEALEGFEPLVEEDVPKLAAFKSWFLPLKGYADRLSAWEVLSDVYANSSYLQSLARKRNAYQVLANVRKLLMLAAEEPELGPRTTRIGFGRFRSCATRRAMRLQSQTMLR